MQEDHPQGTHWRRLVALSLGALEAKMQEHDDECNDREEQEHDPGWASHQVVKWVMKTKEEGRSER